MLSVGLWTGTHRPLSGGLYYIHYKLDWGKRATGDNLNKPWRSVSVCLCCVFKHDLSEGDDGTRLRFNA